MTQTSINTTWQYNVEILNGYSLVSIEPKHAHRNEAYNTRTRTALCEYILHFVLVVKAFYVPRHEQSTYDYSTDSGRRHDPVVESK